MTAAAVVTFSLALLVLAVIAAFAIRSGIASVTGPLLP